MLSLDEAIAQEREAAKEKYIEAMLCHANPNDEKLDSCVECAKENEQRAEWLEELKAIKYDGFTDDLLNIGFTKGYKKALDDFIHKCDKHCGYYKGENRNLTRDDVLMIAEQLKAGIKE